MNKKFKYLIFVFILGHYFSGELFNQEISYWGKIKWITGTPAVGMEVRLMNNNMIISKTFTNTNGVFAFFEFEGNISDYTLNIITSGKIRKSVKMSDVSINNRRIDDILIE